MENCSMLNWGVITWAYSFRFGPLGAWSDAICFPVITRRMEIVLQSGTNLCPSWTFLVEQ